MKVFVDENAFEEMNGLNRKVVEILIEEALRHYFTTEHGKAACFAFAKTSKKGEKKEDGTE